MLFRVRESHGFLLVTAFCEIHTPTAPSVLSVVCLYLLYPADKYDLLYTEQRRVHTFNIHAFFTVDGSEA